MFLFYILFSISIKWVKMDYNDVFAVELFCGKMCYTGLEHATAKCAIQAYWLFWIKGTWKTIGARRATWPSLSFLKQEIKLPCERCLAVQGGRKTFLSPGTGSGGQEKSVQTDLIKLTPTFLLHSHNCPCPNPHLFTIYSSALGLTKNVNVWLSLLLRVFIFLAKALMNM